MSSLRGLAPVALVLLAYFFSCWRRRRREHRLSNQPLDSASGGTNGAPPLRRNSYQTWARVLSENLEDLRSRVMHGKATVMDPYGSSNPAEFFAVAT